MDRPDLLRYFPFAIGLFFGVSRQAHEWEVFHSRSGMANRREI